MPHTRTLLITVATAAVTAAASIWIWKRLRLKSGNVNVECEEDEDEEDADWSDAMSAVSTLSADISTEADSSDYASADDVIEEEEETTPDAPDEGEPNSLFWETALMLADKDAVACRTNRFHETHCVSRKDFLARLHCLRNAMTVDTDGDQVFHKIGELVRSMIEKAGSAFLKRVGRDPAAYRKAFNGMISVIERLDDASVMRELSPRRVVSTSFVDMLDFFILDAFDDMDNPPSSVAAAVSAAGNSWIPASIRGSAIENAVWGVIKAKQAAQPASNEFLTAFYDLSACIVPLLSRILFCRETEAHYQIGMWLKQSLVTFSRNVMQCVGPETTALDVRANLLGLIQEFDRKLKRYLGYK